MAKQWDSFLSNCIPLILPQHNPVYWLKYYISCLILHMPRHQLYSLGHAPPPYGLGWVNDCMGTSLIETLGKHWEMGQCGCLFGNWVLISVRAKSLPLPFCASCQSGCHRLYWALANAVPLLMPSCTKCCAVAFTTPQPAHAIKTNNPMGYPTVGTITLKVQSVHHPFNPFMYRVKQTGDTGTPVWKSLKIHISLCYCF